MTQILINLMKINISAIMFMFINQIMIMLRSTRIIMMLVLMTYELELLKPLILRL